MFIFEFIGNVFRWVFELVINIFGFLFGWLF